MTRLPILLGALLAAPLAAQEPASPDSLLVGQVVVADGLLAPGTFRAICEGADVRWAQYAFADPFSRPPLSLPQAGGGFGMSAFRRLAPACDLAAFRQGLAAQVLGTFSYRGTDHPDAEAQRERLRTRVLAVADTSAPTLRPRYIRTMAMEDARRAWALTITDEAAADYAQIQRFEVHATEAALRRFQTLPGVADAYGATAEQERRNGEAMMRWRLAMEAWLRLPEEDRGPKPTVHEPRPWTVAPRSSD